ncbi:hypothetical protein EXIGLDRAFT_630073, partial [Exidia glandulosa HHB12029]
MWETSHDFLANADAVACNNLAARAKANNGVVRPETAEEQRAVDIVKRFKSLPANIPWSHASKSASRNEIRALMQFRALPALFITVNPPDLHHPLFCKLAGFSVDLQSRFSDGIPGAYQRTYTVAKDPVAAARFFHEMVQLFIDIILGMKFDGRGIFGKTEAYYGMVEAQGRGSLHIHMLVWISGNLPPQALRDRMQSDDAFKRQLF